VRLSLLDRLDKWKSCFDPARAGELENLLRAVAASRFDQPFYQPAALIRLHESLLFLRAYPLTPAVARLADRILFGFADRVAGIRASSSPDLAAFQEPEVSGIAGTSLTAVFSYEVARALAARHPRNVEIAWDCHDPTADLGPTLSKLIPLLAEDWPVEAHVPFRQWIRGMRPAAHSPLGTHPAVGTSDLAWMLQRLDALKLAPKERAEAWNAMQLPITWDIDTDIGTDIDNARTSRSCLRLPRESIGNRKLFYHRKPLLRRSEVSLDRELEAPPLPVRRLTQAEAQPVLDLILDTSSMRYRELYGFSHPDRSAVYQADASRGVDVYFFGVPPEWRLPLRAYHAGVFFKNGVPAGYVELLSLFERAEVGFNLYYTFREGESAWLYGRLLRLFHQVLGVSCFTVDPYQIGLENPEAVDSGAFWFYRKLGFRPVAPEAARLVEREERRMARTPGYRSGKRTLERLAQTYLIYESSAATRPAATRPAATPGEWDRFTIRNLAMALQRDGVPAAAAKILKAKTRGQETRYLRLMQRDARLRTEWMALGSRGPGTDTTTPAS
jgi:hypothetical protein